MPALFGFATSVSEPDLSGLPYFATAIAPNGWRAELAFKTSDSTSEAELRQRFAIPENAEHIAYNDRASGQQRHAFFSGDQLLAAVFLSPQPVAVSRATIIEAFNQTHSDRRARFTILAAKPAANRPDPGATVCSCFSVGANTIRAAITSGAQSVEAVGTATSAGTNCGSCKAEIRSLIIASSKPERQHDDKQLLAAE